MMRAALVLRPEPGNAATAARLTALGVSARRCPLFAVAAVGWTLPAGLYDALLLTSANAVRHAGPGLAAVAGLPVLAVGDATAAAARAAGLRVVLTGDADAGALLAQARADGWRRPLHLAGRDRGALPGVDAVTVYASEPVAVADATVRGWRDCVALLHSARAARRFAALVTAAGVDRTRIAAAAISPAVAEAAGRDWAATVMADAPRDERLVAAACALIDPAAGATDKRA